MKEEIYDVGGMHCAACSASVERVVRKLPGIESADVNLMFGTLNVKYDEKLLTSEQIIAKVYKAGFSAALRLDGLNLKTKSDYSLKQVIVCILLAALLMALSMSVMFIGSADAFLPHSLRPSENIAFVAVIELVIALPVLIIGRRYYYDGFASLIKRHPDMNSLIAVSSSASFLYSLTVTVLALCGKVKSAELFYESAVTVIALVSLGKYFENSAKNKTKDALEKLIALTPEVAYKVEKKDDGSYSEPVEVTVGTLYLGDVILVRQGERVPADATVISGTACADESALTGESLPVSKSAGNEIVCGSILTDGFVYAEVTNVGSGTVIAGIVRFVSEAQRKKAPISRTADKVAGVFVPIVMTIAAVAAVIWLIMGKNIAFAVRIFTSVLVIACPCAMGLATPTAIMSGTGLGAKNGILVRSGEALEKLSHIDTAVFDKTGTVTRNQVRVEYIESVQDPDRYSDDEITEALVSLECMSHHPYADAIRKYAEMKGIHPLNLKEYASIPGRGICGTLEDGRRVTVGGRKALSEIKDLPEDIPGAVYLTVNGVYEGRAVMSDEIRADAPDTVKELKKAGMHVMMISGDSKENSEKIGQSIGISDIYYSVRPEEKAEIIADLMAKGRKVAMIGDGINDAPALTAANVGIAVGNGTDIAIGSADTVLMKDGIYPVVSAFKLGKITIKNIRQNLFWAFCYNTLAIPVACGVLYPAFGILLTPMIGAVCMSLSSLFVVTNALRLGSKKI